MYTSFNKVYYMKIHMLNSSFFKRILESFGSDLIRMIFGYVLHKEILEIEFRIIKNGELFRIQMDFFESAWHEGL